jgi:hypothetical protein
VNVLDSLQADNNYNGAEQNQAAHCNVADPLGMGDDCRILLIVRHLGAALLSQSATPPPHLALTLLTSNLFAILPYLNLR